MKTAYIGGGNGFIGHHMARRLMKEGYWVRVVDIEEYKYGTNDYANEVIIGDLRDPRVVQDTLLKDGAPFDEVYTFACVMGGCQFIFTGDHDAEIMHDSALININMAKWASIYKVGKLFYSSSACIYPQGAQSEPNSPPLKELDAYPADPDSNYGIEKLFSERLYDSFAKNTGLNIRIARFHNVYGPEGIYTGGKEKAPASISRKVTEAADVVKMWGKGEQRRSFMYIDDCVDAVLALMASDYKLPINIGSDESVSIKELWEMAIEISRKDLQLESIPRPANFLGVHGRNSDNALFIEKIGFNPRKHSLREGMEKTYAWISNQLNVE